MYQQRYSHLIDAAASGVAPTQQKGSSEQRSQSRKHQALPQQALLDPSPINFVEDDGYKEVIANHSCAGEHADHNRNDDKEPPFVRAQPLEVKHYSILAEAMARQRIVFPRGDSRPSAVHRAQLDTVRSGVRNLFL